MKGKSMKVWLLAIFSVLLISCSKPPTTNFQSIQLPSYPNYYLVCPEKFCNVLPNAYSPVFPASAEDLFNAFNQVVATQPTVRFVNSIPEQGQFFLEERPIFFNLPSDIMVQFVALSDTTSTLVVYSRSRYGFYDFGANRRLVTNWFVQLNQMLAKNNNGTEGRNRTDTMSPSPDFESGASTSSATPAS
jgi:hypothetical protein